MRVIAGRWRGRRLEPAPGGVRPTADRVREALFNMIADQVDRARVVDLCCGSGALAVEALSRGAVHVDLVDLAPPSLATARANLERCGADPGSWRLHRADAGRWLARCWRRTDPPPVVLADPPYGGEAATDLVALLRQGPPPGILVVVLEHPADLAPLDAAPPGWTLDTRRHGGTALSVLRPAAADEPEARHG